MPGCGRARRRALAPRGVLGRQKAFEEEAVGRQAGDAERGEHRRGAGDRRHRGAGVLRGAHQPVARIGDQRGAGIGHQRDRAAVAEASEDFRPRRLRIVVVIGRERRLDAVAVEQPGGDAGVLARDEIGSRQRLQRPQRDVGEVSDRGGHQIEPGRAARGPPPRDPPPHRRRAGGRRDPARSFAVARCRHPWPTLPGAPRGVMPGAGIANSLTFRVGLPFAENMPDWHARCAPAAAPMPRSPRRPVDVPAYRRPGGRRSPATGGAARSRPGWRHAWRRCCRDARAPASRAAICSTRLRRRHGPTRARRPRSGPGRSRSGCCCRSRPAAMRVSPASRCAMRPSLRSPSSTIRISSSW